VKTWIALLRGVNVVGKNKLPMQDLRRLLEARLPCAEVRTYVASGNVVFCCDGGTAPGLARRITEIVAKKYGFAPHTIVLTPGQLAAAADACPFPTDVPARVHLFFLEAAPKSPNLAKMEALKTTEEFQLGPKKVFYLFTPDGFGKSKLAAASERLLGVEATARNWNTVTALRQLAQA
jgi:uncharacterized protein (DUF1697 family)